MAYGTVKVDNITFTNGGSDQTVTVSGIVQSISGNITATGTIQAATIIGTSTVSGATVTGTAGVFTTVTGGSAGFTTVTGTTVTGTTANFATLSGTTITGSVGNFGSGSEAAPSVSVGTTDNGIYSPGTDQVAISTNGTQRINIDSSGRLLVGTSSSSVNTTLVLDGSSGGAGNPSIAYFQRDEAIPSSGSALGQIYFANNAGNAAALISSERDGGTWTSGSSHPGRLVFSTTADGASSPTEALRIINNGVLFSVPTYNATTASAANVNVQSNGALQRSTSSAKYKTNIETLQDSYADALLNCRPVWYRSTCTGDNPGWGWWGFIAEEVAEIDPRLVSWKTTEITYDEKGSAIETPLETPEPEGVAYDRFVPHLLNLIKRQQQAIEDLQAEVAALKA